MRVQVKRIYAISYIQCISLLIYGVVPLEKLFNLEVLEFQRLLSGPNQTGDILLKKSSILALLQLLLHCPASLCYFVFSPVIDQLSGCSSFLHGQVQRLHASLYLNVFM